MEEFQELEEEVRGYGELQDVWGLSFQAALHYWRKNMQYCGKKEACRKQNQRNGQRMAN